MNTDHHAQRRSWQINMLFTGTVMITVFLGLILAQLDALQVRAATARAGLPIINIQATAVAVGNIIPLDLNPQMPVSPAEAVAVGPAPDDLNPRPEFITGVSEEGIIFTTCGEVPEGWLLYTLQPGESLASLAAGTQSTVADLSAANCLADGQVTAGMQLLVPRQPPATLCGPPQWWVRYQVRPGDTLGALAANRGTTIDEILRANCRDSLDLQAGQSIFLPSGSPSDGVAPIPQPSLTPLPTATAVPTLVPLPTATTGPGQPPPTVALPTAPPPTAPVASPVPPTATPPVPPTTIPPTLTPIPPTAPPPTSPPPTAVPPTNPAPTNPPPTSPPPTEPPPTATVPPPTLPPPTLPPPTAVPTDPPPTDPPPTDPPPTDPPPTDPPPTEPASPEGGG
ncbi:MAG: LysM peptidoglycan-binding domain-containing protein [Candidatus Promineofilum sp.]|nr:LysM peptidoglycan-binding domain-containing protein [Promineifilum sp.]